MATSVSGSTNEWFKIGNRQLTSGRTGALDGEVLQQFLIEAAVLSALVGVAGTAIAAVAPYGGAMLKSCPMRSTPPSTGWPWCSQPPSARCSATSRRDADGPDRGAVPCVSVWTSGSVCSPTHRSSAIRSLRWRQARMRLPPQTTKANRMEASCVTCDELGILAARSARLVQAALALAVSFAVGAAGRAT